MLNKEQEALLAGLLAEQKYINPKYFYDKNGSELFERITQLDEYYPTRTERTILIQNAEEMASYFDKSAVIIEPGAGACEKIQLILEAIHPEAYLPQDVSKRFLQQAAQTIKDKFPWLKVYPIVSDFAKPIEIPKEFRNKPSYVFYPGSTIGNFEPESAVSFLKNMRQLVGDDGGILLGADLHKEPAVIEAAYNDTHGVTAKFNLNMLSNVNRQLGSAIDASKFSHRAFYNEKLHRIEMHLVSMQQQAYFVDGKQIDFKAGETIHTENSYKFSLEDIDKMAQGSGFQRIKTWTDKDGYFSLNFFRASLA
ncbi:L-histidine N(alpha)-methyltransferase [Kangiella sp. TOML190]|uniref:L-histidine N(alpha)-methyltransferase n=1 Tax=Kangiella sp. TOML190 TaxID=2931351 RepID=UPI00203E4C93|nr:L-histidine N(alpha)-methyltransferase [Kangiella sp. TOML190]